MKKRLLTLVLIFVFMMNANAQMTKASVDLTEKETEYDKYSGKYEGTREQEEARLLEILKRDYKEEYGKSISKNVLSKTTILLDTKFENDGFLEFWWLVTNPVTENGRTHVYYVKHKYQYDKIEGTTKTKLRSVRWDEYLN